MQEDKDSLPFQKKETRNYAKFALGIEDIEYFVDPGRSAKNTDRPKFREMMNRIESGEFTHLIIWKIDRISRSVLDFVVMYEELRKYNTTLISTTESFDPETAIGKAMLQMAIVFAELERNMTSERVQAIMLDRARKGLWNGATVPLGYEWCEETKYPIVNKDEAKIVENIYKTYLKTGSTLTTAAILNADNVPTKRGGTWVAKTIRDVLRNPFYIGTYRYNLRDYSKDHYAFKDESEWIVIEDNHDAIISKEIFIDVGDMLSKNYRGLDNVRRRNTNVHIFSKKLYCGNCGSIMTAGLDTKRNDGYQPSRYVCSTYHTKGVKSYCSNFVSDVTLGPFIFNYVSNLISLQENITKDHTINKIEKSLLRGPQFKNVLGIDDKSLKNTYTMLIDGFNSNRYEKELNNEYDANFEQDRIIRQRTKYETALKRLDDLYLFSEDSMSKKDYVLKKKDISSKIDKLDSELIEISSSSDNEVNEAFIDKAIHFIITKELQGSKAIDFRSLLNAVGNEVLEEFISSVIDNIIIDDRQVANITFKNGVEHKLVLKPIVDKKANDYEYPKNGAYRKHFDSVLKFIEENGSASRTDVEHLANIKRYSALTLLNELIKLDKIKRARDSRAIRYYLK